VHDVAHRDDARDLAVGDDDEVPEAPAGHRVGGLLERPLAIGEGRLGREVIPDPLSGSSPEPSERTRSRSVTMPGPGCSGSMITAAPTLCSVMNCAASRRLRIGVIVRTSSVMASRTFTGRPYPDRGGRG
jgi:hypothetical protein